MKVNQAIAIGAITLVTVVAGGLYYTQDALTGAPVDDTIKVPLIIDLTPCEEAAGTDDTKFFDCTDSGGTLEGNENETHEGNKPNDGGGGDTSAVTGG